MKPQHMLIINENITFGGKEHLPNNQAGSSFPNNNYILPVKNEENEQTKKKMETEDKTAIDQKFTQLKSGSSPNPKALKNRTKYHIKKIVHSLCHESN